MNKYIRPGDSLLHALQDVISWLKESQKKSYIFLLSFAGFRQWHRSYPMRLSVLTLLTLVTILLIPLGIVQAQAHPEVQELHGSLAPGQSDIYRMSGLKKGQVLDAFMENISGNLDPILSILPDDGNLSATLDSFKKDVADLVATSSQPLLDLPALRDQYALAWDDDSGPGYASALQFVVPEDGDYFLIAGSSLSAAG
jgi:hypothetical protein